MNIKIAIVDDNSFLIHTVKEKLSFFEDLSFKFSAINGSDLLTQLEDNSNLDLILMDIEMPVKDGYQTTDDIRQYEREHDLSPCKIVAVSAHSMKESRGKALLSGMDDFLSKPIDQNILIDVLTMTQAQSSTPQ